MRVGRGFCPADWNKKDGQEIGRIPIDSIFSPIRNVRYFVEPTRVGQQTDYEKLVLEIETDGSVTPEESLTYAGKILRDHVQLFINFDNDLDTEKEEVEEDAEAARIRQMLRTNVDDLELSVSHGDDVQDPKAAQTSGRSTGG